DDLIDVDFAVEEQSSGSIGASFGFAQDAGLILGLNLQQDNFLGTGKRVGIGLNSSKYQDVYNFSYTNPYYTEDGVSRGFNIFYRATDLDEVNVASYSTNTLGGAITFGYPIGETERLGFSFGISNTEINTGRFAVQEIQASPRLFDGVDFYYQSKLNDDGATYSDIEQLLPIGTLPPEFEVQPDGTGFLDENGEEFLNWTLTTTWSESTLNRGRLATRGHSQQVAFEASMPASDLEFYKLTYRGEIYFPVPLLDSWTMRLRTKIGYGDGYGDTTELPFYEHFFGGGFGSVRGYESNTLGPRSTPADQYLFDTPVTAIDEDGNPTERGSELGFIERDGKLIFSQVNDSPDPFGGNVLIEGGAEFIFPLPFVKDRSSLRSAFFFDFGNVFDTECRASQQNCFDVDLDELRYSFGVGVTWITGFGPMTFSLAQPLNSGEFDEEEVFQFTLGRGF
ncbi:MAG: outer membrane protein insertion porin family, partial [Bacteroidia bacterium]